MARRSLAPCSLENCSGSMTAARMTRITSTWTGLMAPTRSGIVVLATRRSALARKQTEAVQEALALAWPGLAFEKRLISTEGDRTLDRPLPEIGGEGGFSHEGATATRRG